MRLVFEWNANKARENLEKHKVSFGEAKTVFNDPFLLTIADERHSEAEDRYLSIGVSVRSRVLLVVHTKREESGEVVSIRIISCRRAAASERRTYEEGED